MGAYGAYHYMATKPGMFVSVSFMSGWFPPLMPPAKEEVRWWEPVLGPYAGNEDHYKAADIYEELKAQFAQGAKLPVLMMRAGASDPWLKDDHAMRDFLASNNVTIDYAESPGGHNFAFWTNHVAEVIDFHWRSLQPR
jgi:S-formylglutathione hydrolase FrmB